MISKSNIEERLYFNPEKKRDVLAHTAYRVDGLREANIILK